MLPYLIELLVLGKAVLAEEKIYHLDLPLLDRALNYAARQVVEGVVDRLRFGY